MAEQVLTEISGTESNLEYKIDGVSFTSFGVYVMSSSGMQNLPSIKESLTVDWPDGHGQIIDLSAPRYNYREIELECFIKASGKLDFFNKVRAFINAFQLPELRLLELSIASKPLLYYVYLANGVSIEKKWHDNEMFGTFTLNLIEPSPIKRLLICTGASCSFSFTSNNPIDIFWGDGSSEYNVMGTAVTKSKTYSGSATRYILLAGVIEEISAFTILSTNTDVVWSKY